MLFPIKLKKNTPPEELIALLNQETWVGDGKFKIIVPGQIISEKFAMGYVIYTPCEDYRYAISVAPFNCKLHYCRYVKADIMDLSSLKDQIVADAVSGAIGRVAGNVGHLAVGIATGDFKKHNDAKKLRKQLNKELKAFVKKMGI